jgi:hypothetical protein
MGGVFTPFNEIPLLPKYKNTTADRYLIPVVDGYTAGTSAATINIRYFHLTYVPADGQIDVLSFRTATAPSPAYNVHIAIWNCLDDGSVGTYIIGGTGSSGTGATTTINISVTATSITRGWYWMSFTADATGTAGSIATSQSSGACFVSRFLGSTSPLPSSSLCWNYTCATSYSQTTHETFNLSGPTGFQAQIPAMGFQWV